jgi:hypothetical protein
MLLLQQSYCRSFLSMLLVRIKKPARQIDASTLPCVT